MSTAYIMWKRRMARPRHPNKEIETAVAYAESMGWTVEISNGHAWARLYCPHHTPEGCIVSVWSTPKSCQNHAKALLRTINRCSH
jgi:hypothetical protein